MREGVLYVLYVLYAILGFKTTLAHKRADAEHDPWLLHKYPIACPVVREPLLHGSGIKSLSLVR